MIKPKIYPKRDQVELLQQLRCVGPRELEYWLAVAPPLYEAPDGVLHTFCADCLPEHRALMAAEGRCLRAEPHQVCSRCEVDKPLHEFPSGKKLNGRSSWCSACYTARSREKKELVTA